MDIQKLYDAMALTEVSDLITVLKTHGDIHPNTTTFNPQSVGEWCGRAAIGAEQHMANKLWKDDGICVQKLYPEKRAENPERPLAVGDLATIRYKSPRDSSNVREGDIVHILDICGFETSFLPYTVIRMRDGVKDYFAREQLVRWLYSEDTSKR